MKTWKNFKYKNLWQHPLWMAFQKSIGRQVWQLEVEGARALVVRHNLPLGLCWLEVPRGPLFLDEPSLAAILEKIKSLGKKEKAVFVRLSPYQKLEIENWKLKIAKGDHHPETSLLVDLSLSEEGLLQQMKRKGRYNIRLAQRHGLVVHPTTDLETFYSMLKKTASRDGFGIHPKSYYKHMLDALGDKVQLLVAEKEGQLVAGGIFIYLDEMAIYYYGASDHEYRQYMGPYLLQWEAIKMAKNKGCKQYDFLGIAPEGAKDHAWAGVTHFKKKFGGRVVSYPQAKDLVLRKIWYFLYHFKKRL